MRYRTLLTTILIFSGALVMAQSADLRYFETTAPIDRGDLKFIIQAVVDLDADAAVFHSDDMRILQVRANASVTDNELRAALQTAGTTLREGTPDLSAYLPTPSSDAPPIYLVTGNESLDMERYRTAVETWNGAHPDQQYSATPLHMNDR